MTLNEVEKKFEELPLHLTFMDITAGDHFFYAFQSFHSWGKLRDKLHSTTLETDESAYLRLTDLLYTLEGPFSYIINVVIFTLIKEGHHDLWSGNTNKFISSFEEIFNIPLSTRLKFLNAHDFTFFSDLCPRTLRNAVAHQNFLIEEGTVKYNKNSMSLSNIVKITDNMIKVAEIFFNVLERKI